jgi:hypothetical protein
MAKKNATTKSSTPTIPAQSGAPEATLPLCPEAGIEIDIERIAGEAESACEFDPHGGPPVVVVNWAGATVITSTFEREVFWGGVTFHDDSAYNLFARLVRLPGRYGKARANLERLIDHVTQALVAGVGGIAIVNTGTDSLSCASAELKRAKCEERGHLIQHCLERESRVCGFGWYEDLYNRAEAQLFVETLRRRGWTLYNTDNKVLIVNEFAMKINNGEWRFYDIAVDAAKAWITQYFCEVRRNLGRETLLKFRSILIGRIAKAAFRDAALDCGDAEIAS